MSSIVVVGGGISGLLSALILKRQFDKIILIEKEGFCGGLLRSYKGESGHTFDYGTHFLRETGIRELDGILYEHIDEREWHIFDHLKVGNYFRGQLNEKGPYMDSSLMPQEVYQRGILEIMNLDPSDKPPSNLKEQMEGIFGPTFTHELFEPVITKFFGARLTDLHSQAHTLFGLTRLMAFSPFVSREIKKSPFFDGKFSFHDYREGQSGRKSFYPKSGGIGCWVERLVQKMQVEGVDLLLNEYVEEMDHHDGLVNRVRLGKSQRWIDCEKVVWTIPVFNCIKACHLTYSSKPPPLRSTTLFHYVYNTPFQTDLYYFTCFDPAVIPFRVTLYPNIAKNLPKRDKYHCSVEILSDPIEDLDKMRFRLAEELKTMGAVSNSAKLVSSGGFSVKEGFPILTNNFVDQTRRQGEFARQHLKNVYFLGKASGSAFFMNDVLCETYNSVKNLHSPNTEVQKS